MANKSIKSVNLLPEFLRTDKNSKFLSSTLDQLIQPAQLERIDGYIGSKLTPTYNPVTDLYVPESLPLRSNYQLEPALVVKNSSGVVNDVIGIDDLANEISTNGGYNNNFDRVFRPEFYSFNPHIDWDKFVNYQEYYWLTTGPDPITIVGQEKNTTSTYTVRDNDFGTSFIFNPDGLTEDPLITLYRGNTYIFDVSSQNKFYIKTSPSLGTADQYNIGVTNNGISTGTITLVVNEFTLDTLFYISGDEILSQGQFAIKTSDQDTQLNVEDDIIGKRSYTSGNNITLSNGMKIKFGGTVLPEFYQNKSFFVEGVGDAITLVDYDIIVASQSINSTFDENFDANLFDEYPFDNFKRLPINPEYITINRASKDLNPWSRYNRWVHASIIETSAIANGQLPIYPMDKRATRPIIEFKANLQLYNFGSAGISNVDVIDVTTTDAFSIVEGSPGYYVDGILLEQGNRVIFNADTDSLVRGKIYQVNYVVIDGDIRLELRATSDHEPDQGASVSVNAGTDYSGTNWWYNGDTWIYSQQHTSLNQPPLFDLFDNQGLSYSKDFSSSFVGNKLFGYDLGTGSNDPVLGFPLKYENSAGVGSYLFKNYFAAETILVSKSTQETESVPASTTYCKFNNQYGEIYANLWTRAAECQIPILQFQTITEPTSTVELIAIDNPATATLTVDVYLGVTKVERSAFTEVTTSTKYFINFNEPIEAGNSVLLKIYTTSPANKNGYYDTPLGLTNNPLNGNIQSLTLSEVSDHVSTMVNGSPDFVGKYPGSSNIRDLPGIEKYGNRLMLSINPMSFSHMFIGKKEHSVLDAMSKAADQYNQFKLAFLKKISEIDVQTTPVAAVDRALKELNADKDRLSSYFLSDMVAYGTDKIVRTWTVTDGRNDTYPITTDYTLADLSLRSVLVYLNGIQLIHGLDYEFIKNDASVRIIKELVEGDELVINDYTNTEGTFIPATPTKLGLYPKYTPEIFYDDTYIDEAVLVIQGHDGSITVAYNDYRDAIILEFEKRVYNNIKAEYRAELLDINSVLPGVFRTTAYSPTEVNNILQRDFIKWAGFYGIDYITNNGVSPDEPFTWNYVGSYNNELAQTFKGYWRNIYKYFYDTDRPHSHPWEMLGLSEKPVWWETEYGPAPYTSGNDILWNDIEQGIVRHGSQSGVNSVYIRAGLSGYLPVDAAGDLVDPSILLVSNITSFNRRQNWVFGDHGPAETAWRRSSYWPFAVQKLLALTVPATYCALMYDPAHLYKNIAGQLVYTNAFQFLNPAIVLVHGDNRTLTSGYSVYISEIGKQRTSTYIQELKSDLQYVDFNLFHKVGGFISKDKLQIIIDSYDPVSTSPGALLPQEDYTLILNKSNPVKSIGISGIVVQKVNGKFVVKGYDKFNPYFNIYAPMRNSTTPTISVGGISESFVRWSDATVGGNTGLSNADTTTANSAPTTRFYQQGQIVLYNDTFYRVTVSHNASASFNSAYHQRLAALPVKGGAIVQTASRFSNVVQQIPYGTEFSRIQELYDLIIGYGKWLEENGFIFDEFSTDFGAMIDWDFSAKEFLYWTTQNWADNSVIALSPFANQIKFKFANSVVDNIFDSFYEYNLLQSDGLSFPAKNLSVNREDGLCTIKTLTSTDGIYFALLHSVQKEHAMVFNNTTIFADTIYDIETGYRQRRMKLSGFRTAQWDGDFFSPGFVYDTAVINEWQQYTDYQYGDIVRFNGYYYGANSNISGSKAFDFTEWNLIGKKPIAALLPNFDYKINQFEDFYSLDIDNFDAAQQKMAQHLIGYTPRIYLNNIFTNPIAQYKFYQGFIKEKGTKNAISKLAKASIHNLQGELDFTEEWAFRIGYYGSFETYQELEILLKEGTFIENPQVVNFVDTNPGNPNDLIYYSTATDRVILPVDYTASSTFAVNESFYEDNDFKLSTAGFVRLTDITATAYNENSLLDIANNGSIIDGDVVWLGFKKNGDWDVLRYSRSDAKLIGVFVNAPISEITFVTDKNHRLSTGDVISVSQFNEQVNGVYIVKSIPALNRIVVASVLASINNAELLSPGLLFTFKSVRYETFDTVPSDQLLLTLPADTKLWINDNGSKKWVVYQKIKNYEPVIFKSKSTPTNQKLGWSINKPLGQSIFAVGAPGYYENNNYGKVFVYANNYRFKYTLNQDEIYHTPGSPTEIGYSVVYDDIEFNDTGYGLLFAGAPAVSDIRYFGLEGEVRYSTGRINNGIDTISVAGTWAGFNAATTQVFIEAPQESGIQAVATALLVGDAVVSIDVVTTGSGYISEPWVSIVDSSNTGTATGTIAVTLLPISSSTWLQEGAVKISSIDPILVEERGEFVLLSPNPSKDERFGSSIFVQRNTGTKMLIVGAPQTVNSGTGRVYSYIVDADQTSTITVQANPEGIEILSTRGLTTGSQWGYCISGSDDASFISISAPGWFTNTGFVSIISGTDTSHIQLIDSPFGEGSRFGEKVQVSQSGDYLLVSATEVRGSDQSYGKVVVYKNNNGLFDTSTYQIIHNPLPKAGMKFGHAISINSDASTLAVSSLGTHKFIPNTFDKYSLVSETIAYVNDPASALTGSLTTFDSRSTTFFDTIPASGTAYVYNRKFERFVLSEELLPSLIMPGTNYGYSISADDDAVYVGAPAYTNTATESVFYQFNKIDTQTDSWKILREEEDLVAIESIQRVLLLNSFNEEIVDYLDIIDPLKGKIAGLADQELKYKSAFDPAIYSIGVAGTVNDTSINWLDEHVGELWWDLSTVKYIWYEQGDLSYRKNNWGKLFPGATIDVYEWVESTLLPSEWSSTADTSPGLTQGISGQPKYADNSVISVKQVYSSVSNSFSNVYYYWVKNKVIVPAVKNRRISSYQVASIIADPTAYGLKYAAAISSDAIALSNIGPLLVDDRMHLNISFDAINNQIPRHTEWLLLQEGSANGVPNTLLEKKLLDSLLGHDSLGNPVPDPSLSSRTRYGISIRPRQTLFKDRLEALRNLIEFTNDVLINYQITGNYSFVNLNKQELIPDPTTREYDQIVEDNEGLLIIDTRLLVTAQARCTVKDGKLRSVIVDNPGYGYKVAPIIEVLSETNAIGIITTEIDEFGRIVSTNIKDAGAGFISAPLLVVRPYTVIVLADSQFNGKWTKFIYDDIIAQDWVRYHTQKYNTPLYWDYVDWKSSDYNEFVDYAYTVDDVYELNTLPDLSPTQYVKIKNGGDGRYIIVEKIPTGNVGTFSDTFNLVYSQNGTIKILDSIWDSRSSSYGFDQNGSYDQTLYDQTPDLELEYILTALKKDLFVGELKINWGLFFFKAVKYALTEQKLLDWAFKTSFINVVNNAGELDTRPVYKLQNSEYYEDYLKEVKPYHTSIRSFTTKYDYVDPSRSYTTDFDLPTVYNKETGIFESIELGNSYLTKYPWKSWADNYTYRVGEIAVGDGGLGYTIPPLVEIRTAPGDTGSGATARAYISSGKVTVVEVTNPGSGYEKSPTIVFTGGGDTALTPAIAYANLANNKVRTNKIGMRFDRISSVAQLSERTVTDRFVCNGSVNEFVLSWLADADKLNVTATVDGTLILGASYNLIQFTQEYGGYSKKYSKIVFLDSIPSRDQILAITYVKNIDLFSATDRILNYYSPTFGMPGLDLPQLMTGVEYPKNNIEALKFDYTTRWDVEYAPFGKSSWEDDINYYTKKEIATGASAGATVLTLATTAGLVAGQHANIISYTTNKFNTTTDTVLVTDVDAGTNQVTFNVELAGTVVVGDEIEFWNYDENATILDSVITGGTWSTTTNNYLVGALGINPEDIIIDGDRFLTPNTSYAPEELVPGHVVDSLGINVYTKNSEGAPIVFAGSVDIIANTVSVRPLSVVPPNKDSIFVSFNNRLFTYRPDTNFTTSTQFTINWATNEIIVPPQTTTGKLGYIVVSIGGGRPDTEAGVIDSAITVSNETTAQVQSLAGINTVKSAYVTVNGGAISAVTTSTEYGYILTYSNEDNKRAAVNVYNLPAGTNAIQAWFFDNYHKYFNEIKEQVFVVGTLTQSSFVLAYPPGNVEPAVAHAIVEINNTSTNRRLLPPYISYYEILQTINGTFAIDNRIDRPPGTFTLSNVRAYLNGIILRSGFDYTVDSAAGTITIFSGILTPKDVVAIVGLVPGDYEYDIIGNILTIPGGIITSELRVVTYTDHDDMMMRTERLKGNPSRRYKVSSIILNENYVWVQVNGVPLSGKLDYEILDDRMTIQVSDRYEHTFDDDVVITIVSDNKLANTVLGYRIFNDIFNRTHFKRLSKRNTTYLTKPLRFTDTEIHVADSDVLTPSIPSRKIPGVVLIDGERIEFFKSHGNVLSQLRRSTLGTSPSYYSRENTKVIDQSPSQTIPFSENTYKQVHLTIAGSSTYVISTVSTSTSLITGDGIVLMNSPTAVGIPVRAIDQVEVYYGGRLLRKSDSYYHDIGISYDSAEVPVEPLPIITSETLLPAIRINTVVNRLDGSTIVVGSMDGIIDQTPIQFTKPFSNIAANATYYVVGNTIDVSSRKFGVSLTPNGTVIPLNTSTLVETENILATSGVEYIVTSTNQVWTYTNSSNADAINGYVFRGLYYLESEFSINTATQAITLNIQEDIQAGIRLTFIKKEFARNTSWNDEITDYTTKSLTSSTTAPAKFLQASPAELPDNYYYGGNPQLTVDSGFALTDSTNVPLEGF